MDIELIPITLAANEQKRFERNGRYIEVITADFSLNLILSDAAGGQVAFMRNAVSGIYAELPFGAVDVINGATAQNIVLMVSDGRGGSRRQPGVVSVVDAGRAIVLANRSFSAKAARTLAAGVAVVQVFNPAASGRRVIVRSFDVTPSAAATIVYGWNNATYGVITNGKSRLGGGALSTAEIQAGDAANQAAAVPTNSTIRVITVNAGVLYEKTLSDPIVLPPGYGFVVAGVGLAAAQSIDVNIDWNEETT